MSGKPAAFAMRDVTRAIQAAKAAGMDVHHVEISPTGKISVFSGAGPADEVDAELEEFRRTNKWYKSK